MSEKQVANSKKQEGKRRKTGAALLAAALLLGGAMAWGAVSDAGKLWMNWGEAHADSGRTRLQTDATGEWSAREALRARVALRTTATPSSPESIPMPVEPGSRVGSIEIPAENPSDIVKPVWK